MSFDIPTRNNEREKEMNEDARKVPVKRQEPYVIPTPRRDVNRGNGEQPEFSGRKMMRRWIFTGSCWKRW